jgi:protein gp37
VSGKTSIEWTLGGATWNPTTGCDRISPGCDNCYALAMSARLKAMGSPKYQRDGDPRTSGPGFAVTVHPDAVNLPLRWRTSRMIFVDSMSDLFHARVPTPWVADVFAVMAAARRHTFQLLTKRPGRMRRLLADPAFVGQVRDRAAGKGLAAGAWEWPLPNVWAGASVEDGRVLHRIDDLRHLPAAVRWISAEPLLGPLGGLELGGIDWVVVGGESGPGARPLDVEWVRGIVRQCCDTGTPVFVKQLGSVWAAGRGLRGKGGDPATWPEDLRVRQMPGLRARTPGGTR